MDVVVDASVAAAALMPGDPGLLERLRGTRCHAPHLVDAEVGHVLRHAVAVGKMATRTAEAALYALQSVVSDRYPHGNLAVGAWRLRDNLSYYDALYVALAARLGYPLLTADARLARAPGLPCAVELVSPPSARASSRSS
jgi:predicted nucleic acid-binding protein